MATEETKEMKPTAPTIVLLDDDVMMPELFMHGQTVEERMKGVKELKCREDDALLCTFPKAGTHWLGNLIYRLRKNPEEPVNFFPALVEAMPYSMMENLPNPRILVTHLRSKRIPEELQAKGRKIVLGLRNPKDVAVSLFYHTNKSEEFKMNLTWDQFLARFVSGEIVYKNYLDYLLDWDEFANKNKELVAVVYYEDMKSDGLANLRKIANHLGLEKSDKELEQVLADCSINNLRKESAEMLAKPLAAQFKEGAKALLDKDGKSVIYRKGEVGDWKNHFTVAQAEAYDKDIKEKLENCSFRFRYEI